MHDVIGLQHQLMDMIQHNFMLSWLQLITYKPFLNLEVAQLVTTRLGDIINLATTISGKITCLKKEVTDLKVKVVTLKIIVNLLVSSLPSLLENEKIHCESEVVISKDEAVRMSKLFSEIAEARKAIP